MKSRLIARFVFVHFLCFLPLLTQAQVSVRVTRAYIVDSTGYLYTAIGCRGNTCVAAALASSSSPGGTPAYLVFLRSNDGGLTWSVQNPGLDSSTWNAAQRIRRIEVIDSQDVIAYTDSLNVVRTTDAGETWRRQVIATRHTIEDISFANPNEGVLVVADTPQGTFVTNDGGQNWRPAPFSHVFLWQCHAYGSGYYRLFRYRSGELFTTHDEWKTVDSTPPIIPDPSYIFGRCSFGFGDTLIAYGNRFNSTGLAYPCLARSSDAGVHWVIIIGDTNVVGGTHVEQGSIATMSDVTRDTIIACGRLMDKAILRSIDNGISWHRDTVLCNDPNFGGGLMNAGLTLNARGELVGTWNTFGLSSSLVLGSWLASTVIQFDQRHVTVSNFPNPTITETRIDFKLDTSLLTSISIFDATGREVRRISTGMMEAGEHEIPFERGDLPAGVYFYRLIAGGDSQMGSMVIE